MEKWKDLKVYRNLPPKLVPLSFKLFAQYLDEKLGNDFVLKESKIFKKFIYKSSEYFEVSLIFSNASHEKNDTRIKSYIGFRRKYTDIDNIIIDSYRIDNSIKMSYPLTKEFLLLADFWLEKIEKFIIPYLEKIQTPNDIICNASELKKYYEYEIPYKSHLRWILFESAFLERNKLIFDEIYKEVIEEENRVLTEHSYSEFKDIYVKHIEEKQMIKKIFDDDILYNTEIQRRKELIKNYKPYIIDETKGAPI